MERLLITGASGFIGSHLVRQALEAGYEVWAAVRKDSDKTRLEKQGVKLLEVDYYDEEQLFGALDSVRPLEEGGPQWDYVIHNAGITKTARLEEFAEVNAEHTRRLLHALSRLSKQPKRFVLMSSLSSYGNVAGPDEALHAELPQKPNTPLRS